MHAAATHVSASPHASPEGALECHGTGPACTVHALNGTSACHDAHKRTALRSGQPRRAWAGRRVPRTTACTPSISSLVRVICRMISGTSGACLPVSVSQGVKCRSPVEHARIVVRLTGAKARQQRGHRHATAPPARTVKAEHELVLVTCQQRQLRLHQRHGHLRQRQSCVGERLAVGPAPSSERAVTGAIQAHVHAAEASPAGPCRSVDNGGRAGRASWSASAHDPLGASAHTAREAGTHRQALQTAANMAAHLVELRLARSVNVVPVTVPEH